MVLNDSGLGWIDLDLSNLPLDSRLNENLCKLLFFCPKRAIGNNSKITKYFMFDYI
jgi:hypothetical protein